MKASRPKNNRQKSSSGTIEKLPPIFTPVFRVHYPYVFEMARFQRNDGTEDTHYSVTMIFDGSTDITLLKKFIFQHIKKRWPDKGSRPQITNPLKSGNAEQKYLEFEAYKNAMFARAKTQRRIGVVDRDNLPITDPSEIYSGCVCRALIDAYTYDKAGNRGVGLGLLALQKLADGKRIGGVDAVEAFSSAPKLNNAELPDDIEEYSDSYEEDFENEEIPF